MRRSQNFQFSLLTCILALSTALFSAHAQSNDIDEVNQLLKSGKQAQALAKVEQSLSSKPRDAQMRFLKGVIQTEMGKPNDAISTFTKLIDDYPELPEPYNNLAVLHASQGQYDKARAALEMAIRTNPSYSTAHENLGDIYANLASQAYTKALQMGGASNTIQPKLSLIRELFSPTAKGQNPNVAKAPATVAPAAPVVAAVTNPVTAPATAPAAKAPAANTAPVAANSNQDSAEQIEQAVQAWAKAWASKDMKNYLAAYGKSFEPPKGLSRKAWEEERRDRIVGKSHISVKISNLKANINGDTATAKFRQAYDADSLSTSSTKTLTLAKAGQKWYIVKEVTGG
ncbi:MAG TPA: tetratricopeptide repeat protein [Burkholderiaceae bacterium]|nr:tetratricopeptide repeat protein [Burkholderiaceae bacterium]